MVIGTRSMSDLMLIYSLLAQAYGCLEWWPAKSPFEVMVGAVLTQNTAWRNVEKALANLGENCTPQFIAEVSRQELITLIRPCGFYNRKAACLKDLTFWFKKYDYALAKVKQATGPCLRSELLAIKGVGKETADSILTYALQKPYFVIDAYTRRILSRWGFKLPKAYDILREQIESNLPLDLEFYQQFHALFVELGKRQCRKKPLCTGCPLEIGCQKLGG